MAYSQLGYYTTPQFLMTSDSLTSLEADGRSLTDTVTPPSHATLSGPVYEDGALSSPRLDLPMGDVGVYSCPYPKNQSYYNTCSGNTTTLYPRGPLDSKDGATSVRMGTSQAPAYYPYEYTLGQYSYDRYSYCTSEGTSRRKNATRETTSTLKAWLQEHQKNPYPTKGEKIMLAIITRMTLTQVSTWFANARRRLKKENKVTWSPRASKSADDRGCDDDSDGTEEPIKTGHKSADLQSDLEDFDLPESEGSDCEPKRPYLTEVSATHPAAAISPRQRTSSSHPPPTKERLSPDFPELTETRHQNTGFYPGPDTKPKIWSIARTAFSLDAALEQAYPPCMLSSSRAPSPGHSSGAGLSDRQRGSPVSSLREWVDGVFHEPPFQHRALTQALPGPGMAWKGLDDAALHRRTLGHSYEHISTSSL